MAKIKKLSRSALKEQRLKEIMRKFACKLTATELYEILNAGQYIYSPDEGLTYISVFETLKKEMGNG